MQIAELVHLGISELTAAGIHDCTSDVYLLLSHSLAKSRTQLLLDAREHVSEELVHRFKQLIKRRASREPVAYILGEQEFWSRSFLVSPSVLIPRPETEFLLETVLKELQKSPLPPEGILIDLCCGSGVIAIILALELRRKVLGVDRSGNALEMSVQNCKRHGVEQLVSLIHSDLLESIAPERSVPLVVSNPPYVSSPAIANDLEPEVAEFEPEMALDGGEEGLDLIERIRLQLPMVLMPGGRVFMEIGYDQGDKVRELFREKIKGCTDFNRVEILKDYAGRDRVLYARLS